MQLGVLLTIIPLNHLFYKIILLLIKLAIPVTYKIIRLQMQLIFILKAISNILNNSLNRIKKGTKGDSPMLVFIFPRDDFAQELRYKRNVFKVI